MTNQVLALRNLIKSDAPLIHNITNVVVTNFTANGLYAAGAKPVMAYAPEEAADMASAADALVLNIGTLSSATNEAMLLAGKAANKHGKPVILDPVGAGATSFRTESAAMLLKELDIALIRGNSGEIASLAGSEAVVRGVDASAAPDDASQSAVKLARSQQTTVCMTGEVDVITDGSSMITVHNGSPSLQDVTGAGCLLSSIAAAFISRAASPLEGAAAACAYYGVCAEAAAARQPYAGPGHFQIHLLDMLQQLTDEQLEQQLILKEASL
ncbi:hydroxyethylthiazole kinase [Bacillus daqingensis]|uniref:Hydroxyethylthiazole kinase n=1 Tax=Bacillus daqingensis TaxID=872396 RepID=A0ABV9NS97_9BACI